MSYTKNTWKNGDTVTAAKLNNIEDGVAAASVAELPAVSGSDNGKALMVSGGQWEAGNLPTELPAAPAEDGTYTLKVTVADGTATYAWVSDPAEPGD